jgi:hypothetical protein
MRPSGHGLPSETGEIVMNSRVILAAFLLLMSPEIALASKYPLVGTWKLKLTAHEVTGTGEIIYFDDQSDHEHLTYLADGSVVGSTSGCMFQVAGTYAVQGDRMIQRIELPWMKLPERVLSFKIENDTLTTTMPLEADGQKRRLVQVWEKVHGQMYEPDRYWIVAVSAH